jgi:hypothetical protein
MEALDHQPSAYFASEEKKNKEPGGSILEIDITFDV